MADLVSELLASLVLRHEQTGRIDLNDIAEIVGDRAIGYEEVELVIQTLEERGFSVGGAPSDREMKLLREVLTAARRFRDLHRRSPKPDELARATGLAPFVVRRALENGQWLARGPKP